MAGVANSHASGMWHTLSPSVSHSNAINQIVHNPLACPQLMEADFAVLGHTRALKQQQAVMRAPQVQHGQLTPFSFSLLMCVHEWSRWESVHVSVTVEQVLFLLTCQHCSVFFHLFLWIRPLAYPPLASSILKSSMNAPQVYASSLSKKTSECCV